MFNEVSYLGATWAEKGFASKAAWKQAGKPGAVDKPPPVPTQTQTLTIPTTEPNQCPPGMTYSAPPPGSGTGTCTGPQQVSTTGGIGDLLGGIDPTYLLIGGAVLVFFMMKGRGRR